MGRTSRRVLGARKYHDFSKETLQKALEAVNSGRSLRSVSREFGIAISTLSRKRRGLFNRKYGGQKILSDEEEQQIVHGIKTAGIWGFPLTVYDVKMIVKNYLDKIGRREKRFENNVPGRRWMQRFLHDNRNVLSERNAENIKRSRAEVSETIIKDYFTELETSLQDVPSSNIINYDETNFTDDPGKKRVIVKRGTKHPERCVDSSKSSVSVMMAGTADGVLLPPYIVYKSEHLYDTWTSYGPKGARYNRSKSGWFDMRLFEEWFQSIVVPFVRTLNGPKVLIGDNLSSHVSASVIAQCEKHDIRFILLPANSTHLCQPLDVSFFHPLKAAWRKQLDIWKAKHRGCVTKDQFPMLLRMAMESLKNPNQNLINGFSACGICPLDSTQVLKRLPTWVESSSGRENAAEINKSFVELLQSMRSPNQMHRVQRKKRLNVAPGKSISGNSGGNIDTTDNNDTLEENILHPIAEEVVVEESSVFELETRQNSKKKNIYSLSDSSSNESVDISIHDSSSEYEKIEDVLELEDFEDTIENIDSISNDPRYDRYSIGDFLLVEFKSIKKNKQSKYFVGQIVEVLKTDLHDQFYCKFMRKKMGPKAFEPTFVFPSVDDLSVIDMTMVRQKLEQPQICRGHHIFKISDCETLNLL